MLPDIMASGLQKPRSVIFARFCLSSWRGREKDADLITTTQKKHTYTEHVDHGDWGIYTFCIDSCTGGWDMHFISYLLTHNPKEHPFQYKRQLYSTSFKSSPTMQG